MDFTTTSSAWNTIWKCHGCDDKENKKFFRAGGQQHQEEEKHNGYLCKVNKFYHYHERKLEKKK